MNFGSSALIQQLIRAFVEDAAPKQLRKRMSKAIPKIVAGMTAKGMTPDKTTKPPIIRDALFRLWRSVIPSGDIADFVRDHTDDKIVPIVEARLRPGPTLEAIVQETLDVLLEVTF
jgi:hypothetical protein